MPGFAAAFIAATLAAGAAVVWFMVVRPMRPVARPAYVRGVWSP